MPGKEKVVILTLPRSVHLLRATALAEQTSPLRHTFRDTEHNLQRYAQ